MNLSNIVNVTIDRQTSAVTAAGFGLPLFLGLHSAFAERYREYEDVEAVGADFSTLSPEYKAAQSFFGQEISVSKIAIGRRHVDTVTLTPTVANTATYSVTLDGNLFTYVSDATALATEIVAGLTAAINAHAVAVTASGASTLVLTADVGGVAFAAKFSDNLVATYSTSESLTSALTAVAAENNGWYGLACYSHNKADILEVAAYAQAAKKVFGSSSADADIKSSVGTDSTSTLKALKDAGYDRTFLLYSLAADATYPECGWIGGEFAKDPGASVWGYKQIAGTTVSNLTSTESSNILAKNGNTYESVAGQNITSRGTMASGEWIDIIRDTDWLTARIQERVYFDMVNLPKIPYTTAGLAIIESALRAQLAEGVERGVISEFTVSMPKVANISPNDRAARLLPNVKFSARIAGSVNKVEIRGTVTV